MGGWEGRGYPGLWGTGCPLFTVWPFSQGTGHFGKHWSLPTEAPRVGKLRCCLSTADSGLVPPSGGLQWVSGGQAASELQGVHGQCRGSGPFPGAEVGAPSMGQSVQPPLEELAEAPGQAWSWKLRLTLERRTEPLLPIPRPEDPRQVWVTDGEGTGTSSTAFYLKEVKASFTCSGSRSGGLSGGICLQA